MREDRSFYPDGVLKSVLPYLEKKLHGEVLLYWPNGQLKRRCFFKDGVRCGKDEMYRENGALFDEGTYEEGKAIGMHRRFHHNGQKIEETEYLKNGKCNLRRWNEKGDIEVEAVWTESGEYHERVWDRFEQVWRVRK